MVYNKLIAYLPRNSGPIFSNKVRYLKCSIDICMLKHLPSFILIFRHCWLRQLWPFYYFLFPFPANHSPSPIPTSASTDRATNRTSATWMPTTPTSPALSTLAMPSPALAGLGASPRRNSWSTWSRIRWDRLARQVVRAGEANDKSLWSHRLEMNCLTNKLLG